MKKKILGISIVVLMLVALVSGCTETNNNNGGTTEPKTVTMNAQEFSEDMKFEPSSTGMKTYFESLNDGDTLIFQDKITGITYDETNDITTIASVYESGEGGGVQTSTATFVFDGNITGDYSVENEVKITVTIKHVTMAISGYNLDMEIYEENWVSEEYYKDNYMTGNPLKGIPSDKISKV